MYESRVRGISPAQAADAMIRLEWCEAAARRAKTDGERLRTGRRAKGVDVAQSENGDKAAIADFDGALCEQVRAIPCQDANKFGRDVIAEIAEANDAEPGSLRYENVGIDPIGVGVGALNELRAQPDGAMLQALNAGAPPLSRDARGPDGSTFEWVPDESRFADLSAQMWWQLREDLRLGRIGLPYDPQLFRELTTRTFDRHAGKVRLESKKTLRKRMGGKSPDKADALVFANWVRPRAVELEAVDERWRAGRRTPDRDPARFLTPDEVPASVTTAEDALSGEELLDVGPFARDWGGASDSTFDWLGS
jgi:phage terminase large subunit